MAAPIGQHAAMTTTPTANYEPPSLTPMGKLGDLTRGLKPRMAHLDAPYPNQTPTTELTYS